MENLLLKSSQNTINKGLTWLKENRSKIEQINDLSAHYKAPYLYASVGDPILGKYYADLMKDKYFQQDGDFRTSIDKKGWGHLPSSPANRYIYSNGWIICGLRQLSFYGLANKGLNFIKKFQSADLGGFASHFDPLTGNLNPKFLDSSSTSSAGLALLECGDIETACRAGDFILKMLESQPNPDRFYYCSWDIEDGLRTKIWGEENVKEINGRKQFCLSSESDPRHELTWLVGKPMKYLSRLYDQTNEEKYLLGARALLSFFEKLDGERIHNYGSCKVMWASAELYRLTGEDIYFRTAEEILRWFCDTQQSSGVWVHTLLYQDITEQPFEASLDIVQELCAEINDTVFNLFG